MQSFNEFYFEFNAQSAFNITWEHFVTLGYPKCGVNHEYGFDCVYNDPKGLGCAIGNLLSPRLRAFIQKEFPGGASIANVLSNPIFKGLIESELGTINSYSVSFLGNLQVAHDGCKPMKEAFTSIANEYNLTIPTKQENQ